MRLDYNISEYLRRMLPQHKRQTNRLALFWWPLSQLSTLWITFRNWRNDMVYESNITGQKLALENFLNKIVENASSGIRIIEYNDGGIWLSKVIEASDVGEMSLISEATDFEEIAKKGEQTSGIDVNFKVLIPSAVSPEEVRRIVDRYLIAGFEYEVTDELT